MLDPFVQRIDALVHAHGERFPAHQILSAKDYDELARRIVVQPVTPLGVALLRLKERECGRELTRNPPKTCAEKWSERHGVPHGD